MPQSNDSSRRLGSLPMPATHPVSILTSGAPSVSSSVEIQNILLELIEESDLFRLRRPPYFGADELAMSIREHGQSTPLFVRGAKDGRFELISGYRRRAALLSLNAPTALCRVYQLDDKSAFELALSENQDREALTDIERAEACLRLQGDGYSTKQIAHHMGWESERQVFNYLRLAKEATPQMRLILQKKLLTLTVALEIVKAFGDADFSPELQEKAIQGVIEGDLSGKKLDAYLRRLRQQEPEKKTVQDGFIKQFKNGGFSIAARVDPKNPETIEDAIVALRSALDQARRLKRKLERDSVEIVPFETEGSQTTGSDMAHISGP